MATSVVVQRSSAEIGALAAEIPRNAATGIEHQTLVRATVLAAEAIEAELTATRDRLLAARIQTTRRDTTRLAIALNAVCAALAVAAAWPLHREERARRALADRDPGARMCDGQPPGRRA